MNHFHKQFWNEKSKPLLWASDDTNTILTIPTSANFISHRLILIKVTYKKLQIPNGIPRMRFKSHNTSKIQTNANCYGKQVCIKHEKNLLMIKDVWFFQTFMYQQKYQYNLYQSYIINSMKFSHPICQHLRLL